MSSNNNQTPHDTPKGNPNSAANIYSTNGLSYNLDYLRQVLKRCIEQQQYKTAAFWADKIVCLSNGNTNDVYQQALCFYQSRQYHRAAHCIKTWKLHKTDLSCKYLAARCHVSLFHDSNNYSL